MDPLTLGLVGGGVASSLIGLFGSGSDASKYMDQAIQQLIAVHVPDPAQQKIELERYRSTGQLSPQLEHSIQANPSALQGIVQNQKYSQAQDRALSQLQEEGNNGGMRLSDKAALQGELLTSANKDKANRDAITDQYAQRGQLGSGMQLQAQLAGAQSAGDRDAQSRLSALASAQDRSLQAIQGAGDLAGKLQTQDYGRQKDIADAKDKINLFNTQNLQDVQQRNVAGANAAQAYNLNQSQDIANKNVDTANKEQQYNKSLEQQNYENQMQKANGIAGVYKGAAGQANYDADKKSTAWSGVGSGFGQAAKGWNDWLNEAKKKPTGTTQ